MSAKKIEAPLTIDDLEKLLNAEDEAPIEIMPNGEIRRTKKRRGKNKPLTMRKNLGGEYGLPSEEREHG